MEYNALGYSGSNSGGNLIIEDSIFRHNTTGIAPNSENPGDGPPPQNGACEHSKPLHKHKGKLPEFTSTEFAHCTIIRDNLITENNDLDGAGQRIVGGGAVGRRSRASGRLRRLGEHNEITNNPSDGVLAFEYPNPYPPKSETIYFQNAGNKIANNTFSGNGYRGGSYARRRGIPGWGLRQHEVNEQLPRGQLLRRRDVPGGNRRYVGLPEHNDAEPDQRLLVPRIPDRTAGGIRKPADDRSGRATAGSADDAQPVRKRAGEPAVPLTA